MYQTNNQPNTRLYIVDALRGIAIAGIILLHYTIQMDFLRFSGANGIFNKMIVDFVNFALTGKMYSIFALLFGLSFFIQNDNQMQKGKDFSLRFMWRMFLLLLLGIINTFFFSGDILVSYALFGMLMPLAGKLSTKTLAFITIFLLIQPVQLYQIVAMLINPNYPIIPFQYKYYDYDLIEKIRETGSFWECGWNNLKMGLIMEVPWNLGTERFTQLPGLFLLGIIIGRIRLFYNENGNMKKWLGILIISFLGFFFIYKFYTFMPDNSRQELLPLLRAWSNLLLAFAYISQAVLLFYSFPLINKLLMKVTHLGQASLTSYSLHSIFGAMFFYGWGFGLHRYCEPFISLLIGFGLIVFLFFFNVWWFKTHKRGPLEGLWKKLTWINAKTS